MSGGALRCVAASAAFILICGPVDSPRAAPKAPAAKVRVVVLSAAEIAQLGRDWQPMHRAAFDKLLRQASPATGSPADVGVPSASYEATFAGDSLTAGRLSVRVRRRVPTAGWLDLGDVNLAISELRQGDREVVWGTTAAGRLMARVTDDTLPLTGSWTLAGERIGRRYRFDVRLIPATASHLALKLPRGYRLEASAGSVSGPHPPGDSKGSRKSEVGGRRSDSISALHHSPLTPHHSPFTAHHEEWRVAVSTANSTLLTVIPPEPPTAEKPIILLETETAYVVRDNGLQIQFRAIPEVLQEGIDGLTFRLPAGVRVYAVDYGGRNTPLEFTTRPSANGQRLHVRFPDPLLGRGRAVTVQAVADLRLNQQWELPRLEPVGAIFLQGQVHLRVERPLVFQSVTSTGTRQTTGISRSQNGETLSFDCHRPDTPLQLTVARPATRTECRAVTHLEIVGDQWRATSEMTWTARGGPLYTLRCRAPAGWQPGLVQVVSSLTPETERTVSWTEQRVEQGQRLMSLDLPSGIPTGESVTLRISATRPARSRRRRLQWPVIAPVKADLFDSVILMPPGLLPPQPASPPKGFRRLHSGDVPKFVRNSKLWRSAAASVGGKPVAFHGRPTSFRGPVFVGRPEPAFDGTTWTFVESSANSLREQFSVSVVPQDEPVDAVLVYLSRKGPKPTWALHVPGGPAKDVRAAKLPASRLTAWNLPVDGELWEIRLSQPIAKPFEVVAERTRVSGPERRIALPFLPQARRFVGHVEAASAAGRDIQPDANDHLFPIDAASNATKRPAGIDIPRLKKTVRLWRFRTARAALTLRQSGRQGDPGPRTPVNLELWSVLSCSAGGSDAHRAVFRLPPEPRVSEFTFQLPESARIRTILLNGGPVESIRKGDGQAVQSIPAERENTIEIRYAVASAEIGWSTRRSVAAPRCSRPIGDFRWRFAMPPHVALAAGPPSLTSWPLFPQPSWRTRLFGPLARSAETPIFNPLSDRTWQHLFEMADARSDRLQPVVSAGRPTAAAPAEAGHYEHRNESDWAPGGWSVHTAAGVDVPPDLALRLSNRDRSRLWAWIGLLFCLTAGWAVRRVEFGRRRKFAAVWLSTCLAAALFVPVEFAEFAGACLAGSLIATVVPRRLIRREAARDESVSEVPPGSTISYPRVISTALVLIAVGILAADAPAFVQPTPATTNSAAAPAPLDSNSVVVPAPPNGEKPGKGLVVYVHRELLASLEREAELYRPPRYVLRRAAYRVSVTESHSADITATYDAVVVDPKSPVSVLLPIQDAALCGADACRVNGRIHPVRRDARGIGFIVDIPPAQKRFQNSGSDGVAGSDLIATVGVAGSLGLSSPRKPPSPSPRSCRIELCLQARVETVQKDERLQLRIPRVASGELELHRPFDSRDVVVPGLSGVQIERGWFSQSLSGRLAPADVLEVLWPEGASPASRQPKLTAEVRGLADFGAAKVRVRYHVGYQVESGSVNSIVWNVPRNWVLRSVVLPDAPTRRPGFRKLPSSDSVQSRIRIDLPAARSKPFALTAEFVVPLERLKRKVRRKTPEPQPRRPLSDIDFRLRIPRLHVAKPGSSSVARVDESSSQFAVASSAEVGIAVTPSNQAAVRALDRSQFTEFRRHFPGSRLPDYVYEVQQPTVLDGSISPYFARRNVRQTQTGRISGEQLLWTFAADVTVESAPAYRHELLVDPRLIVESVSVLEDGASRLVRWSRTGNRVHLFLSDKTAATQKVVLEARMPVKLGAAIKLPDIRLQAATVDASQILLFRETHVGIDIVDRGDWERFPPPAASVERTEGIAVAVFRLPAIRPANPRTPRIRPAARNATLKGDRLTVLRRAKQGGWTAECTIELRDALPHSHYTLFLPREIAADAVLNASDWDTVRDQQTDSGVLRRLRPRTPDGKIPLLTIRYSVPAVATPRWELLLPVPEFAGLKQDVLAIVADGDAMTVASPADRVRPSAVPAWMSPRLRPLEAAVFRGRGRSWQLAAATAGPNAADLKVPFLETCIWLGGSDVEYGSTLAFVAPAGQPHVSFRWPQGILLRSLHVNGRAVTATVTEGRLNVPLDSSLDFVRIDWERKTGTGPRRIGRDSVEFPSPASTNGTPSLVTIVPAQRQSVFRIRGIETLEAIDYALRRIELLLEIADGHPPGQSAAATSAVEAAGRAYRGLTQFLKSPSANAQVLDDDVRQRLGRIDAALEEQKRKAESGKKRIDSAFRLPPSAFDSAPQIDGMHYGELHPADVPPEVAFWHIDRWLLAGLLAAATLLVTLPFARPLFRAEIGERLTHWEPVSWIVLGTVWWLFLVPSAVGLLLFSVAVAKLVRRWLRRRTSGNVIRLYELSKSGDRRSGTTR